MSSKQSAMFRVAADPSSSSKTNGIQRQAQRKSGKAKEHVGNEKSHEASIGKSGKIIHRFL
jgi:hypothetical protein